MHCQIMPEESPRLQYAQTRVFVCGPKKVHILIVVCRRYLNKKPQCEIKRIYFCRFSVSFLRLFLEKDWIDYLARLTWGLF